AAAMALVAGVAGAIALLAQSISAPAVTRVLANAVAVIDPVAGRVLRTVAVGARPGPLVAAGGSVWAANLDDDTITRIDAAKPEATKAITPGGFISGLAGGGRSLWVSDTTTGVVRHVDTTVLASTQLTQSGPSTGNQSFDGPQPVAVGAGSLWVAQG